MTRQAWSSAPVSLSVRVPALAALLMILLGIAASQQVLTTLKRVQIERVRELAELQMEAMSVATGPHVLRNDIWEVYDTLRRAGAGRGDSRLAFIAVAGADGRVLAASDPARAPIDSPLETVAAEAVSLADLHVIGSEGRVALREPLTYEGRRVGAILAEFDVRDLLEERHRVATLLLLWNAAATAGLAFVGYVMMRRMLAPVTRLARHIDEHFEAPVPIPVQDMPRGDAEMVRLAQTYNTMARTVQEKAETERRLAERERFVSLGRLSTSLAHEINNPLGGLLNAADTIRKFADRPEVVRTSVDLLSRGLLHLRDVTRATLDQHRVDRSGRAARRADLDDLRLLIEPEIRRQAHELSWRIEADDALLARLPAATLRQIVLNLLLNAVSAAGREGKVGLAVESLPDRLRVRVSDTGPGLSAEARNRLMGKGPVAPGGGVGLRVVRDLVVQLGGEIALHREREPEVRTVIEVTLPAMADGDS